MECYNQRLQAAYSASAPMGVLTEYHNNNRRYDIMKKTTCGDGMQLAIHMVTIEDLMPKKHFLRKLEAAV